MRLARRDSDTLGRYARRRDLSTQERKDLIEKLQEKTGGPVLAIVTGDRQGMETRIAPDILALVSEHLTRIGWAEQLALFLYTPGGDTIVGWGLVNLVLQYCTRFKVLVPFRALSCGTLIALGADEIIVGKHGLLSPVDPSVASPFNPIALGPQMPGAVNLLPVSVEDMVGFLDLAQKEIGLKTEESMVQVLSILAQHVHPMALGAVYRAREQSNSLARSLLLRHMDDEAKVERIVKKLTQELPTHNYLIGRAEAVDQMELDISLPDDDLDKLMWELYKEYEGWLQLTRPASPELDLGAEGQKRVKYERAVVESVHDGALVQHVFVSDKELRRIQATPPGTQMVLEQVIDRTIYQGWVAAKDGEVL